MVNGATFDKLSIFGSETNQWLSVQRFDQYVLIVLRRSSSGHTEDDQSILIETLSILIETLSR